MKDGSAKIDDALEIIKEELWFTASRSGGPGGQHVNKVSSRVTLYWDVSRTGALSDQERERVLAVLQHRISKEGVLLLHVDEERSQHANKEIALERLAELLEKALTPPKRRKPTKIPAEQKQSRLDDKRHRAELKKKRHPPDAE